MLSSSSEPAAAAASTDTGLICTEIRSGDRVELAAAGDVDLATTHTLVAAATRLINEGIADLVLNLDGVSFIDSTGLAGLVKIRRMCDAAGCNLQLALVGHVVAGLLRRTGLGTFLNAARPSTRSKPPATDRDYRATMTRKGDQERDARFHHHQNREEQTDERDATADQREIELVTRISRVHKREQIADDRHLAADARHHALDAREEVIDNRRGVADERDRLADLREAAADRRDAAADKREREQDQREIESQLSTDAT